MLQLPILQNLLVLMICFSHLFPFLLPLSLRIPLTNSGSLRLAKMLPFSPGACLLGLLTLGELSRGGGGGGGGGATFSLLGEMVSSNHCPKIGSLSSSEQRKRKVTNITHFQNINISALKKKSKSKATQEYLDCVGSYTTA